MAGIAFTRASTLGPILDVLEQGGGSVERVFQAAELPLQLCANPDALIPLREQFKIVEFAARELGDETLPARLATSIRARGLGTYGKLFLTAPTLRAAIEQGNRIYTSTLQSATEMALSVYGPWAQWTYRVTDPGRIGRQKNEILALGYMIDLLRQFCGRDWFPARVAVTQNQLPCRSAIEAILRCELSFDSIALVVFPAEYLEFPSPRINHDDVGSDRSVPVTDDFLSCVQEVIRLGLLAGRPQRAWTARRLGLSLRTLQRRLHELDTSYASLLQSVITQQATQLVRSQDIPISEIAYNLGYSDPSHFTRAFAQRFGQSPSDWRRRALKRPT